MVDAITDDHLFPKSWYPETTPANLEKWKIPACEPCNKAYGKLEAELRLLLAASLDPDGPASAGIWRKAFDSLNPNKGRNALDSLKRKLAREKFLKRVRPAASAPKDHVLPEIHADRPKGSLALLIPAKEMHRFVHKLVRGTVYLADNQYIEQKRIGISFIPTADEMDLVQLFQDSGQLFERGPAIRIRRAVSQESGEMLFMFDIWDQFRVYAYTEN